MVPEELNVHTGLEPGTSQTSKIKEETISGLQPKNYLQYASLTQAASNKAAQEFNLSKVVDYTPSVLTAGEELPKQE